MRRSLRLATCLAFAPVAASAQGAAPPADAVYTSDLMTRWGKEVTPANAWRSYPRPQLKRERWLNLNGLWDYAIAPKGDAQPARMDGQILVPFPVESKLSRAQRQVPPGDRRSEERRVGKEWVRTWRIW